jgi:peptidoglycan/LPS O-acetylase OafA/YrhL
MAIARIESFETKFDTTLSPYVISIIIGMFYLLMFLVANNKLKSINSPKLLKIGVLTYPLYLIHQIIGYVIFNNLSAYMNKYLIVVSTIFFMIFASYLISEKVEPIIHKLLKVKLEQLII